MALTHKEQAKKASKRNEMLRATRQAEYGDIPAEYFVWLDELSVDDKTNLQNGDGHHLGVPVPAGQHSFEVNGTLFSLCLHVMESLHWTYSRVQ
jgi:hypothetical protein